MRALPRAGPGRRPFPKCALCPRRVRGGGRARSLILLLLLTLAGPVLSDSQETGHMLGCARNNCLLMNVVFVNMCVHAQYVYE